MHSLEIHQNICNFMMPTFSGIWWGWFIIAIALLGISVCFSLLRNKKKLTQKSSGKGISWSDHFVYPPEHTDSNDSGSKHSKDLFEKHLHLFWHRKSSRMLKLNSNDVPAQSRLLHEAAMKKCGRNFFIWDDGLIFSGFKLQGIDLRTTNLYGAYLRDMYLKERRLDGSYRPLIFRDTDSYSTMDMSSTFLKNEILRDTLSNGADLGRFDLSGLYLRDIGLQGIDISDMLKPEDSKFGDYFISKSHKEI